MNSLLLIEELEKGCPLSHYPTISYIIQLFIKIIFWIIVINMMWILEIKKKNSCGGLFAEQYLN